MRTIKLISVGSDPETFLSRLGEGIISGEGIIGGTKHDPMPLGAGYYIQEDNVLMEFNTPPAKTAEEFVTAVHTGLKLCNDHMKAIDSSINIEIIASNIMDNKWLQSEQAQTFGCDPDYCAHTRDVNEKPNSMTNLRTAGGHVHIGYDGEGRSMETDILLVKGCDLFLGLPSINKDKDDRRRELYGKAGAFRFKVYGIEYRTLSNFWLKSEEDTRWVFNQITKMFEAFNTGKLHKITEIQWKEIATAINTNNKAEAKRLCEKYQV